MASHPCPGADSGATMPWTPFIHAWGAARLNSEDDPVARRNRSLGQRAALALLIAVAVAAGACGGSTDAGAAEPQSVRGQIIEVVPLGLLDLDSLTIEDFEGERWQFEARGARFFSFSPSHLTEHMVQGLPVTVTFRRDGDALVASGISD